MDIVNLLIGIGAIIIGVYFTVDLTKKRNYGDKGGYGAHTNIYFGAISFIVVGLVIVVKELLRIL